MYFYLIGADYKTMPFEVREELYRQRKKIAAFWIEEMPYQAAVFTTCNRIEIYALARNFPEAQRQTNTFFRRFPEFSKNSSLIYGYQSVFLHALRLACGLESQLQGETQILQQLEAWQRQDGLAPGLRILINNAIYRGREIRSRCSLHIPDDNLATIVYDDIKSNLGNAFQYNIVILGTGKIAELFCASRPVSARLYFAAHKNFSKAKLLAQQAQAKAVPLREIFDIGLNADVLIGATSSPHIVLGLEDITAIVRLRTRPLYVYDLAFPRNIEPKAATLPGVILQNLDTLHYLFEEKKFHIREKISLAEYLCSEDIMAKEEKVYA